MSTHYSGGIIASSPDSNGAAATQDSRKDLGDGGAQTHLRMPQRLHVVLYPTQSWLLAPGQPSVIHLQVSDDLIPPLWNVCSQIPELMKLWNVNFS